VVGLGAFVAPAAAIGIDNAIAVQPGATLLLPYFEVDLGGSGGPPAPGGPCPPGAMCGIGGGGGGGIPAPLAQNTVFHIGNSSATAILAHVTIWSDLSVPVFTFDIYLTGYDVQHVNLRDVLNGILPRTAGAGSDPTDTISPQGPVSQDINFASCVGSGTPTGLPYPANIDTVRPGSVAHMRAALTGQSSTYTTPPIFNDECAGLDKGDNIARGYVTVDTVTQCNLDTPATPGYFSGVASYQNTLFGDWYLNNPVTGATTGGPLVHIAANIPGGLDAFPVGTYTFYGRYSAWTALDQRQPLATTFAVRYTGGPPFAAGTNLLVWRDSQVNQGPFACGSTPAWYPLTQTDIVAFDERESVSSPAGDPFPAEAQAVQLNGGGLPLAFTSGWLYLNLNSTVGAGPPTSPNTSQAWVIAVNQGSTRLGGPAVDAVQLDNATEPANNILIP
jgi:hypothetical protein